MRMSYRDNVESFKRADPDREGLFVEPDDYCVIRKMQFVRDGCRPNAQQAQSNIVTAEALVCVMDRLDRIIELLEERA